MTVSDLDLKSRRDSDWATVTAKWLHHWRNSILYKLAECQQSSQHYTDLSDILVYMFPNCSQVSRIIGSRSFCQTSTRPILLLCCLKNNPLTPQLFLYVLMKVFQIWVVLVSIPVSSASSPPAIIFDGPLWTRRGGGTSPHAIHKPFKTNPPNYVKGNLLWPSSRDTWRKRMASVHRHNVSEAYSLLCSDSR